jgi:hypothetical protein
MKCRKNRNQRRNKLKKAKTVQRTEIKANKNDLCSPLTLLYFMIIIHEKIMEGPTTKKKSTTKYGLREDT